MRLHPIDFAQLLLTAPEDVRLLWTPGVRQWLYDRKDELMSAILAVRTEESPISWARFVELQTILASASRRSDTLDLAGNELALARASVERVPPTDERVPYLLRNIAKEEAMLKAVQGDRHGAAESWHRVADACGADPALQLERARALRQARIFFLEAVVADGTAPRFGDQGYSQFRDAMRLLTQLDPSRETEIQTRIDILRMDWFLDRENPGARFWLLDIREAISAHENLHRAFNWSWKILFAAYAARQDSAREQTEAYEIAMDVRDDPKVPLDYRMEAGLACMEILFRQKAYADAMEKCRQIIRENAYTGPARTLAKQMTEEGISALNHE